MQEEIRVLIEEEKLFARIKELAEQVNRDYAGKELVFLCILKGSVYFACELSRHVTVPVQLEFIRVSSYGDGMVSSGKVKIDRGMDFEITGKHVMVVEDIVDTGRTLSRLLKELGKEKPASLRLCALLNKPECRVTEVPVDYVGFEVPDRFIVGFGLDYAQKYRNLSFIGELKFKEDRE